MKCNFCKKQYVGKSETSTTRLVKKPDTMFACKLYQERNYVFNKQSKFIIIYKLTITTKSKDILRQRLIKRETFGI